MVDKTSGKKLWILDLLLNWFLFFPLMVMYWRGIWDLWGVHIYPNDPVKKEWAIFAIGSATILGYIFHPVLGYKLRNSNVLVYFIVTRIYMALFGSVHMAYWRGLWILFDIYLLQFGWKISVAQYCVSLCLLLLFKCHRNVIFAPASMGLDTRKDLMEPSTKFGIKPKASFKYGLDSLFTHFICLSLTISAWRSTWNILDTFIIPDNYLQSNIVCFIVGYILIIIVMLFDYKFANINKQIARHYKDNPKRRKYVMLMWQDGVYVLTFWVHAFLWRGMWNLNASFLFPDPEIGGWINNLAGTTGFLLLQLFSYVGSCGVGIDGTLEETEDTFYSTQYLREYIPLAGKSSFPFGERFNTDTEDSNTDDKFPETILLEQKKMQVLSDDHKPLVKTKADDIVRNGKSCQEKEMNSSSEIEDIDAGTAEPLLVRETSQQSEEDPDSFISIEDS